jgi:hypothetical protein
MLFKFIYLCGEPRLLEEYVPVSKCSPDLGSTLSILTYTPNAVLPGMHSPLSSSCCPPRPAIAVIPGTRTPLSNSGGSSHPDRAVLHDRPCQLAAPAVPPHPARVLAHQHARLPEA